ncbi:ABC transporter ATP-binding protein [Paenibacillus polymyxa]|uniref:ABC transporter ATP-binding protein n=1 Tax=Paenibacillus polymyxa TaxID=1406 RepID=A0AAE9IC26_PAEPO|nr:ABC transporter ATP-binding protein [Paenibacillus polymyxa]URJ50418.1 ABC transporter ATP-binding protein [Paenibacillus polymyxa]
MKLFLFKYRFQLILLIICIILSSLMNMYMAFIFKKLVDTVTTGSEQEFVKSAFLAVFLIILGAILRLLTNLSHASYMRKTMLNLKEIVFGHILNKSLTQLSSNHSAKYISIFSNDIKMIEDDYFKNIFSLIGTFISFSASLLAMFLLSPTIVIALVLLTLSSMFIPRMFEKKLVNCKRKVVEALEKFMIHTNDMYSGFAVIKSFGIEGHVHGQFDGINQETENQKYRFQKLSAWVASISEVFGGFMFISVFIIGSFLTLRQLITLGTMIACVQLTNSIVNPIQMSIQYITQIKSLRDISAKITQLLHTERQDKIYIRKPTIQDKVSLKEVSFGYKDDCYNVHGLNMDLELGKKYALVGPSGSGKSTVLRLLMKQYENYKGRISIDEVDLKEINMEDWCRLESVLHQDVFLFDSSIKENIVLHQIYSDKEIEDAIQKSGLSMLINKLPNGMETQVGEKGSFLSGGEKQRIAIARTLIRRTPLLLMDEPTSSLDQETANAVEETVLNLENTTCVMVTHRLSKPVLERYDMIFVFADGAIIEKGTFCELIELQGCFYHMYGLAEESTMTQHKDSPISYVVN